MGMKDLHLLGAVEVARMVREGVVSSVEVVEACLARVREVDGDVQAWTFLDPEYALAQARAADEVRMSGRPIGALHGVPVGLKDIIDTADMPTENGSVLHAGRTPSRDASVVSLLRGAGAIILGKTVTTEFATRTPGKTRNPHNSGHTPGGSSSGSAAAVAAGMVPLALGSQTTGSTIRPASFCGVFGLKPTHGLIPRHGMFQLSRSLDHVGLFARGGRGHRAAARRARRARRARSGFATARPLPYGSIAAAEPPLPPMFAFVKTSLWDRVDADAREAFAELVSRLGDRVEELELTTPLEDVLEWQRAVGGAEIAINLGREWEHGRDKLSPALRQRIADGRDVRAMDYLRALGRVPELNASFTELFEQRYDAILTPAGVRHRAEGPRVDRRSRLLRAVDALRDAGAQRPADAGRQRSSARGAARRRSAS
jgi:Asp-tRNA(Asn)/Glu-tRNA(Gln) amidotransferase A subunit family amidase